jgi:ankyrin repeat protein
MNNGPKIVDVVALGQIDDVKTLIARGGNVNDLDEYGNHPSIIAASRNDLELLKILVAAGAQLNVFNPQGENPLYWAELNKNTEMIDFINSKTPNNRYR